MALTMTTVVTMNETRHGAPSTPPSNPCPREGKGMRARMAVVVMGGVGNDAIVAAAINCCQS